MKYCEFPFNCSCHRFAGATDPSATIEMKNANTISLTTPADEQIDNAELQDKETVSNGLDDNENDKENNKTEDDTNATAPDATDLNNGPVTEKEESCVFHTIF